jgi:hypothetical protein
VKRCAPLIAVGGLGLLLAACSSPTTGAPAPATSANAATSPATSSAVASPSAQADPLASVDPCSLLTSDQMSKNGLTSAKPDDTAGIRGCDFTRPTGQDNTGYAFGINFFDHESYQKINFGGYPGAAHSVGGRPGLLVQRPDGGFCELAFEITATSAVEIVVTPADNNVSRACTLATQGADVVNKNLPSGI